MMSLIRVLNGLFCRHLSDKCLNHSPLLVCASALLMLFLATVANALDSQPADDNKTAFSTVEWFELMPEDDLDVLLNPPKIIDEIEDGSLEDQISSQIQNTLAAASDDRYQQALVSTRVVKEMDGKAIRIPGFAVPLEYNDQQAVTQFFLVPYFGACIHVPPPPPNQIILVNYPQGMALKSIQDPLWVSGVLKTSVQENDLATSAYMMEMKKFEAYNE